MMRWQCQQLAIVSCVSVRCEDENVSAVPHRFILQYAERQPREELVNRFFGARSRVYCKEQQCLELVEERVGWKTDLQGVYSNTELTAGDKDVLQSDRPGFRQKEDRPLRLSLLQGYNSQFYQTIDPYQWVGNMYDKYRGAGVRVAVMDTGLHNGHGCVSSAHSIDFSHDNNISDLVGHGSFISGIIGSKCGCRGISADSELFVLKVYDQMQESRTKWALDAQNYALEADVDVVNLSMGGPDHLDEAYTAKIEELLRRGIVVVSAIGNDGPVFGSLSNPGDMLGVIGVGSASLGKRDGAWSVSSFSSRGEVAWSLPLGAGRAKPDLLAPGMNLRGVASCRAGEPCECTVMSGTSMSTPIVTAIISNMLSTMPRTIRLPTGTLVSRKKVLTASLIRKILMSTATKLSNAVVTEQGAGLIDYNRAMQTILNVDPTLLFPFTRLGAAAVVPGSVFTMHAHPSKLDFLNDNAYTDNLHALYYSQPALLVNITLLQPIYGVTKILKLQYHGSSLLNMTLQSPVLFSSASHLDVSISVTQPVSQNTTAEGYISILYLVHSEFPRNKPTDTNQRNIVIPVSMLVTPTPPKQKRVLFSAFHQVVYPHAYVPRDDLGLQQDLLDWFGDHPRTNYRGWAQLQHRKGYFVELQTTSLDQVDQKMYGSLLLVDTERGFTDLEIATVQRHVASSALNVIVFADWFNNDLIQNIRFYDTNTASTWVPVTGGANVPALNALLQPYGITLGDRVFRGPIRLHGIGTFYASGTSIVRFPKGGRQAFSSLYDVTPNRETPNPSTTTDTTSQESQILDFFASNDQPTADTTVNPLKRVVPVLGVVQPESFSGHIAVYGDSNCLDLAHRTGAHCHGLLYRLVDALSSNVEDVDLPPLENRLSEDYVSPFYHDDKLMNPIGGYTRRGSDDISTTTTMTRAQLPSSLLSLWSQVFKCAAPTHASSMRLLTLPSPAANRRYVDQGYSLYSHAATVWARDFVSLLNQLTRRLAQLVFAVQEWMYVCVGVLTGQAGASEQLSSLTPRVQKLFCSNVLFGLLSTGQLLTIPAFPLGMHHASVVRTAESVIIDDDCSNSANAWCELKQTLEGFVYCDVFEPLFFFPKSAPHNNLQHHSVRYPHSQRRRVQYHHLECASAAKLLLNTVSMISCDIQPCIASSKHLLPLHYAVQRACNVSLPPLTRASSSPFSIHRRSRPATAQSTLHMSLQDQNAIRGVCESLIEQQQQTTSNNNHSSVEPHHRHNRRPTPLSQLHHILANTTSPLLISILLCMTLGAVIVFAVFCRSIYFIIVKLVK